MGFNSPIHWILVLLVVILLFGAGRISGVMGDLGKGIKSFKKGLNEDDGSSRAAASEEPAAPPAPQGRITDERPVDQRTTTSQTDSTRS